MLEEIANRLKVDELICSRHNRKTGVIIGKNCRAEEKVRRLYEVHKPEDLEVMDVYSDSYRHDKYIFHLRRISAIISSTAKKCRLITRMFIQIKINRNENF